MTSAASQEPVKITIAGKITDAAFHKCVTAVRHLQEQNPEVVTSECLHFFETQWEEYMAFLPEAAQNLSKEGRVRVAGNGSITLVRKPPLQAVGAASSSGTSRRRSTCRCSPRSASR